MNSASSLQTQELRKECAPLKNGWLGMGREQNKIQELREELRKLMAERIESMKAETFVGPDEEALRRQDARLKRIREVSADLLLALKHQKP